MEEQIQEKATRTKIINTVITVTLILAVLLCLFIAIQVMTTGHASVFGVSMLRVVTGSMEPEMPVGSILLCQQTDIESIAVDDIVCFHSKDSHMLGKIITHRVIRILTGGEGQLLLETKGDANAAADIQYVTAENLIGKVTFYVGRDNALSGILSFLTSKLGFLGCIVFPCLIIAGIILKDCVKSIRGDLSQMMDEIHENETHQKQLKVADMTEEEYAQMAAQIRAELTEELKKGAQQGQQDN